jgi:hypothetical protein
MSKTLIVTAANGDTIAEYPDFEPGQAVEVLPAKDGSNYAGAADGWAFVGPTRHSYNAVIRETRYNTTVHIERNRLRPR